MYICAFKFDINWFTTLPGMLISGGVVLLLLALLLFATSGKKKKVKKEDVVATNVAPNFTDPAMNVNVGMDPMMNQTFSNDPSLTTVNQVEPTPIVPNNTVDTFSENMQSVNPTSVDLATTQPENITPVEVSPVNSDATNTNMESVQPINIEPTPVDSVNPINQEVNSFNITEENTEITPTVEAGVTPNPSMTENIKTPEVSLVTSISEDNNMQISDIPVASQLENNIEMRPESNDVVIPSVESTTTAYGGVSPAVDLPKEEVSHQIYGGANPLDKTQTIPVINNPVEQNTIEEKSEPMEKTAEIPVVNNNTQPVYKEAKLVEDKDIEVLDF